MLEKLTVEERLTALEREVASLKLQLDQLTSPKGDWLEKVSGSMKDLPEFKEAMKYAAEILRADQPPKEP